MSTRITYNGKEVKLKHGDSAVVETRDKKLLHHIEIKDTTVTEPITITENGVYPVPKGGGLEFGTDWKFKDVITEADFEKIFENYPLDENGTAFSYEGQDFRLYVQKITDGLDYFGQAIPKPIYHIEFDPMTGSVSDMKEYYCFAHWTDAEIESFNQEWLQYEDWTYCAGWQGMMDPGVPTPAPVIPNVSESTGINPEHVAPLFDVPGGKALDGWGDITVNVAGGGEGKAIPKFDKFAKFKKVITEADFEEYFSKAKIFMEDESQKVALLCIDKAGYPWVAVSMTMGGMVGYAIGGHSRMYMRTPEENGWYDSWSGPATPVANDVDTFAIPSATTEIANGDTAAFVYIENATVEDMGTDLADTYMFFDDTNVSLAPPNILVNGSELTIADASGDLVQEYKLYSDGITPFATIPKTADVQKVDLTAYTVPNTPSYAVSYMRVKSFAVSQLSSLTRYDTP